MIAKDLERELETLSARTPTELDVIGRELRRFGFSPTGGRGTSAPEIDADVAANFLIAAAGAPKAVSAAKTVFDVRPLEPVGGRGKSFQYAGTFGDALCIALESSDLARIIDEALICRDAPVAKLRWQRGSDQMECTYTIQGASNAQRPGDIAVWGSVTGGAIHQLALELAEDGACDAGWSE